MNNFVSLFEELSRLYEEDEKKCVAKTVDNLCSVDFGGQQMFTGTREECEDWIKNHPVPAGSDSMTIKDTAEIATIESLNEDADGYKLSMVGGFYHMEFPEEALYRLVWRKQRVIAELKNSVLSVADGWDSHIIDGHSADCIGAIKDFIFQYSEVLCKHIWALYKAYGNEEVKAYINDGLKNKSVGHITQNVLTNEALHEDADAPVEDVEAEMAEQEQTADEAAKQLILECTKCGALVCKEESDVTVDEETDLANVDEACAACEETAGYKILGELHPYENEEATEVEEDLEADDEELSDAAFHGALAESKSEPAEELDEALDDSIPSFDSSKVTNMRNMVATLTNDFKDEGGRIKVDAYDKRAQADVIEVLKQKYNYIWTGTGDGVVAITFSKAPSRANPEPDYVYAAE